MEVFGHRHAKATFSPSVHLHCSFARHPVDAKKTVVSASGHCQALPSQHRSGTVLRCWVTKYVPAVQNTPKICDHLAVAGPGAFAPPWAGNTCSLKVVLRGQKGPGIQVQALGVCPRNRLCRTGLLLCGNPDSAAGDGK